MTSYVLQNIAARRKALRLSQRQMARLLQMDQSAYCRLETGRTEITLTHLERISQALHIQPHHLLPPLASS